MIAEAAVELAIVRKPADSAVESAARQKLLSISASTQDHVALRRLTDQLDWCVWPVKTCREALQRLVSERFEVVFCDSVLEDGCWKHVLEQIGTGAAAPLLIVTSRLADACLWSEVLNLGGYDVLAKPFDARDVRHVLTTVSLRPRASSVQVKTVGAH